VNNSASPPEARIEITSPKKLNLYAMIIINAYGVLLATPVLLAVLAVTVVRFSWITVALPLGTVLFATFFLPFGFGNAFVSRLVRGLRAAPVAGGYIVQLTANPRLYSGTRALLEDADDVGWLTVTDSHLLFEGDCVRLSLPLVDIDDARLRNIGFRGFFVSASRICVSSRSLPQWKAVDFSERSSMVLPGSRNLTREIWELLSRRRAAWAKPSSPASGV
jgi:hypothetical protein